MRACPICRREPHWHFASNVSRKRGEHVFLFTGCEHAKIDGNKFRAHAECFLAEAQWDGETEKLLAAYTESWTEAQRATYRAALWPPPKAPFRSELFDRNREEKPIVPAGRMPYANDSNSPF